MAVALLMLLGPTGEGVALSSPSPHQWCVPLVSALADVLDGRLARTPAPVLRLHRIVRSPRSAARRDALRARAVKVQSAMQKQNIIRMEQRAFRTVQSARTISTALSVYLSVRGAIALPSYSILQRI